MSSHAIFNSYAMPTLYDMKTSLYSRKIALYCAFMFITVTICNVTTPAFIHNTHVEIFHYKNEIDDRSTIHKAVIKQRNIKKRAEKSVLAITIK